MLTHEEISSLDEILQRHNYDSSSVIAVMQDIQRKYRYLPQEALTYIAHELHLSEAKVYGVATFYENFSLDPRAGMSSRCATARHATSASLFPFWKNSGTSSACPEDKPTSDDMLFTLETVSCLGAAGSPRYAPSTIRFMRQ